MLAIGPLLGRLTHVDARCPDCGDALRVGQILLNYVNNLPAAQKAQPTAYLLDPEGQVGRSYGARTTPHMYVVNPAGALVYRGGVQDAGSSGSGRNHVLAALSELKAGKPVSVPTSRPYGCSVKYG